MSKNGKFTEEQFFQSGKVIKDGVEWPESTPVELPIGYKHPPSITELIATMVRTELQMREEMGEDVDEVEREEDFSMDEDGEDELLTPAELHYAAALEKEALVRETARARKSGPRQSVGEVGKSGVDRVEDSPNKDDAGRKGVVGDRDAARVKGGVDDGGGGVTKVSNSGHG